MKKRPLALLCDPAFLVALTVLIVNDSYLKYAAGGVVTGKLSDFSGLFAFPFFWSVIFPNHRRLVHVSTFVLFVFWKMPISTPIIDLINETLGTSMSRIVDYTDFIALISVPLSFWYFNRRCERMSSRIPNYSIAVAVCVLSLVAFVATSIPTYHGKLNVKIGERYWVPLVKQEIFEERLQHAKGAPPVDQTMEDTLFYFDFRYRRYTLRAKVNVVGVGDSTRIDLIEIDSYATFGGLFSGVEKRLKRMRKGDFAQAFQRIVVRKISNTKRPGPKYVHYWNARTDTSR